MIVAGASAYSRIIDWKRFRAIADEVGATLMADMAHYAGLVATGRISQPGRHRRFRHQHHAQDAARPRGGLILAKAEHEKAINSAVFPGIQGGPLMHVIAAKAVAFKEALRPDSRTTRQRNHRQCPRHGAGAAGSAACASSPAAPTRHMFLVDLRAKNITGTRRRGRARAART